MVKRSHLISPAFLRSSLRQKLKNKKWRKWEFVQNLPKTCFQLRIWQFLPQKMSKNVYFWTSLFLSFHFRQLLFVLKNWREKTLQLKTAATLQCSRLITNFTEIIFRYFEMMRMCRNWNSYFNYIIQITLHYCCANELRKCVRYVVRTAYAVKGTMNILSHTVFNP